MKRTILFLAFLNGLTAFSQKFDQLAMTPPMGWNSWNTFQTKISEQLVMQTADKLVSSGMRDAGYVYLVLDDGWMAMQRDSVTGDLVADREKFPHGMKAVADYVHSKGLKFGLYNCAGTKTCAGYPGTRGYEYQDARYYASVGIDYLKFDWCFAEGENAKEAYTTMMSVLPCEAFTNSFCLVTVLVRLFWTISRKVSVCRLSILNLNLPRESVSVCACIGLLILTMASTGLPAFLYEETTPEISVDLLLLN